VTRACAVALASLLVAGAASAQDSTMVPAVAPDSPSVSPPVDSASARPPATAQGSDSVALPRRHVTPMGAFWRSFVLPGWGQAATGRRTAAAFFLATEGVTLGMVITTSVQLNHLKATNSGSVEAKSQQREDWLVLLGVNHLLAAMEAYVSAHLWDFPGDLSIQAVPGGGVAGSLSVPIRLR